jgi:flagellar operon protein
MTRVDLDNRILTSQAGSAAPPANGQGMNFGQVLLSRTAAQADVKFSGHAQARLASRQITLSSEDIARLGAAMTRAAQKGARESLVLMDKAALVVSVPNRTVITAVDKAALKENLFTNIDSAMIL